MALLRHRRPASFLLVPQWHSVLTRRRVLRLVVQRALRAIARTISAQRPVVQAQKETIETQAP